jgi:hypothetical protein
MAVEVLSGPENQAAPRSERFLILRFPLREPWFTRKGADSVKTTEESAQSAMQTYKELKELAVMCAYNARTSTSTPVAIELWNMAKEYQRRAAQLGSLPDIGDPPPTIQTFR